MFYNKLTNFNNKGTKKKEYFDISVFKALEKL